MIYFDKEINTYFFKCPYEDCRLLIAVEKNMINCKIFRHGVDKKTFSPIHPHTNKEDCQALKKENKIYGCGKPFLFDGEKVSKCDYI